MKEGAAINNGAAVAPLYFKKSNIRTKEKKGEGLDVTC